MSIGHQNDILVHNRRDYLPQGIGVDRRQNRTDCRAAAISGTSTGTCSSDRSRLLALPPLRRALRSRFRAPFRLSGTQVSSASTMPVSLRAFRSFAAGNRCRQRNAVLTASPQRSAEARTVSPSARQAPKESHLSLRCRSDKGVPVAASNVFLHPLHWYRRRPLALPRDMAPGAPQCGHWQSSPTTAASMAASDADVSVSPGTRLRFAAAAPG